MQLNHFPTVLAPWFFTAKRLWVWLPDNQISFINNKAVSFMFICLKTLIWFEVRQNEDLNPAPGLLTQLTESAIAMVASSVNQRATMQRGWVTIRNERMSCVCPPVDHKCSYFRQNLFPWDDKLTWPPKNSCVIFKIGKTSGRLSSHGPKAPQLISF
jgi:hypothetical protein